MANDPLPGRQRSTLSGPTIQADSEAWEAFLAHYGVLSSMADRSPELAAELRTVVDFMATGPRKKSPPPAP